MAGLQVLMDGGNATDAAITAAAALNVVEPNSTGVGGDLFALVWNEKEKSVRAINGSGRACGASDIEELTSQGYRAMPGAGPYSVCVPGTVHGWEGTLRAECGTMPLSRLLEPAIRYAEDGFPVSEVIAFQWENNLPKLRMYPSGEEMLVDGNAPKKGDVMRFPTLAATLRAIAEGGCEAFYHGPIAEKMAFFVQEQGGWLTVEDLAAHTTEWDEPITTDYRGVTCWECPPNGQGIAALEALNIVEGFDIAAMGPQSPDAYHHLIEAMRLAFADAYRYVADPRVVDVPTEQLVSKSYAAQRRELMDPRKAMITTPYGQPIPGGNTVYVSAVDGQGNACSLINSIFSDFGSGMVAPGTGIVLHNRAGLFSLDHAHPNALAPRKRPYHTIIPGLATKDGRAALLLRHDGRVHAAPGPPAAHEQHGRPRHGPAAGRQRPALHGGQRPGAGRGGHQPRHRPRAATARPQAGPDGRTLQGVHRRRPGDLPRPPDRGPPGRYRTPQGRRGRGLVGPALRIAHRIIPSFPRKRESIHPCDRNFGPAK